MALTSAWFHGPEMGLDLGWKNGLVMWASHVSLARWINVFEIASRGKQMVSKEGLKKLAQIFGLNLCFWGTQFWPPNSIEPCFGTAPTGSGVCGGPIFGASFCEQFGLIMTSAAQTKRKKSDTEKLKLYSFRKTAASVPLSEEDAFQFSTIPF